MDSPQINDKIDLLKEQIASIERSGFYTEKDIELKTKSLKQELDYLMKEETLRSHNKATLKYSIAVFASKSSDV